MTIITDNRSEENQKTLGRLATKHEASLPSQLSISLRRNVHSGYTHNPCAFLGRHFLPRLPRKARGYMMDIWCVDKGGAKRRPCCCVFQLSMLLYIRYQRNARSNPRADSLYDTIGTRPSHTYRFRHRAVFYFIYYEYRRNNQYRQCCYRRNS